MLVQKWAERLGFGHYAIRVRQMPAAERGKTFGSVSYDHQEEWATFHFDAPKLVELGSLEHTVVHEWAHVLLAFGQCGEDAEEAFCNRLGKLLARSVGPRQRSFAVRGFDDTTLNPHVASAATYDRGAELLDVLPTDEAYIVKRVVWGRASLREVAREMNITVDSVLRLRDRAYRRLGSALVARFLEGTDG